MLNTSVRKLNSTRSLIRHSCGISLIEVLVSVAIASFGLLALVGVNVSSIRYTKMSQYRGTATQLAADIGERIRANKAAAANYTLTSSFSAQATLPSAAATLCDNYLATCSATQVAAWDLQTWRVIVRNQLPDGSANIVYNNASSSADIWIVWRDPVVANADDSPTTASECPNSLSASADTSVRCSYFRINL